MARPARGDLVAQASEGIGIVLAEAAQLAQVGLRLAADAADALARVERRQAQEVGRYGAAAAWRGRRVGGPVTHAEPVGEHRSEEHTSELQSRPHLVCRLLLEKK